VLFFIRGSLSELLDTFHAWWGFKGVHHGDCHVVRDENTITLNQWEITLKYYCFTP